MLKIPAGTAKSRVHNGVKFIREELEDHERKRGEA
jgi:RNA polymerase sigma-70 factor (ECF subfamily)